MPWGVLTSNAAFYLPAAGMAWIAGRLLDRPRRGWARERTIGAGIVILAVLLYGSLGNYFTRSVGAYAGDEAHYVLQARSLHQDGDLDLRNNLIAMGETNFAARGENLLLSNRARGGHIYSWLPYGLPALLSPFLGEGFPVIHVLLGLISGLGLLGTYLLCRRLGAGRASSLTLIAVIGSSTLWAVYSARVLPEILGATLLVWTVWAISVQRERALAGAIVAAACGAGMMFTHQRLIAMSLLCAMAYGLRALTRPRAWSALALFSLIYGAGMAFYAWMQFSMFRGGTGYEAQALFDYPAGAWGILSEDRGILATLPAIAWLLAAQVEWLRRERQPVALLIAALVLVNIAISCTNEWYLGGSSLHGRYLLATLPLLAPGAARMFETSHRTARRWLLFLALVSTTTLALLAVHLPQFGRAFNQPLLTIPIVVPSLRNLLHPLTPPFYYRPDILSYVIGNVFAVILYIGTWMTIRERAPAARLAILAIVTMAFISHPFQPGPPEPPPHRHKRPALSGHHGSQLLQWRHAQERQMDCGHGPQGNDPALHAAAGAAGGRRTGDFVRLEQLRV